MNWMRGFIAVFSITLVLLLTLFTGCDSATSIHQEQEMESRILNLIQRMTLAEKLEQLSLLAIRPEEEGDTARFADRIQAGLGAMIVPPGGESPAFRNELQKIAVEQSRLGIPVIFGFDVIHGLRTVFPIPLGMACAFDPDLYEKLQTVAARESRASGIDWVFNPICDLARDPRWGRVAETFGEDPFLGSLYVKAAVAGLQGGDVAKPDRVAACLKHFAGYGASVGGRDYNHTEIPDFMFRNKHLPQFKTGVDAGVLTLMSSFNANDGIPSVANRHLLTDILRTEWKFQGFVVSDWDGVHESMAWGYAANEGEAARLSLSAGNDMEMQSNHFRSTLPDELNRGMLDVEVINEAVKRVLRVKFKLGLFDRPYTAPELYRTATLRPESIQLAREAVVKSAVLLKNNGVLPLSPETKSIALIGPLGDAPHEMLGCWAGKGRSEEARTLASGIASRVTSRTRLSIVQGCDILESQPMTQTLTDGSVIVVENKRSLVNSESGITQAVLAAQKADVVILALGEPAGWTGENASRASLGLTGRQQELFDRVISVGKPVVVVLFNGRPLTLPAIYEKADAVLEAWQPGIQAGPGLADLIFGDANPQGRLAISIPRDVGQLPVYYNRYHTGRPKPEMSHYRDLVRDPIYPFGFGLSYTEFSYDIPVLDSKGKIPKVWTTITNIGKRAGNELVQLYIRDLACSEGARPEQELRGFQRVELRPGESRKVEFELTPDVLGFIDRRGNAQPGTGDFMIWIAPHSMSGTPIPFNAGLN